MEERDKSSDIEKLTKIFSQIQTMFYKKQEQLEELKSELDELRDIMHNLSSMISTKSFSTADEIYFQKLRSPDEYFSENIPKETVKDSNIKRKIFASSSESEDELLAVLNFKDFNTVHVKFTEPEKTSIKETSESFIKVFLKGALIKIKDENKDLELKYSFHKDTEIIESIEINNLKTMYEYDLITSKIRELLIKEPSIATEGL